MDGQKFCLKWDGFQSSVTSLFDHLRQDEELVDITLCCESQRVKAHRMMLSACSPYFRDLLKNNPCQQMVIFLKDTSAADLFAIIEFMYKGSVNVSQSQLASFIKTAEMLQIRGLSGDDDKQQPSPVSRRTAPAREPRPQPPRAVTPPPKRRRTSGPDAPAEVAAPPPPPTSPPEVPSGAAPPTPSAPRRPDSPVSCSSSRSLPSPLPVPAPSPYPSTLVSQPPPPPQQQQPAPPPSSASSSQPPPQQQQHSTQPAAEAIKVEKTEVDLTEDDDASLDATLGYVAEYEGGYGEPSLAMAAHDSMMAGDAAAAMGALAGPSQRLGGEEGSTQGASRAAGATCGTCGKTFQHTISLALHRKVHEGLTTCMLCGMVSSRVGSLRRHLESVHKLSRDDIRRLVNS